MIKASNSGSNPSPAGSDTLSQPAAPQTREDNVLPASKDSFQAANNPALYSNAGVDQASNTANIIFVRAEPILIMTSSRQNQKVEAEKSTEPLSTHSRSMSDVTSISQGSYIRGSPSEARQKADAFEAVHSVATHTATLKSAMPDAESALGPGNVADDSSANRLLTSSVASNREKPLTCPVKDAAVDSVAKEIEQVAQASLPAATEAYLVKLKSDGFCTNRKALSSMYQFPSVLSNQKTSGLGEAVAPAEGSGGLSIGAAFRCHTFLQLKQLRQSVDK